MSSFEFVVVPSPEETCRRLAEQLAPPDSPLDDDTFRYRSEQRLTIASVFIGYFLGTVYVSAWSLWSAERVFLAQWLGAAEPPPSAMRRTVWMVALTLIYVIICAVFVGIIHMTLGPVH